MMAAGIAKGERCICIYSGNSDKWVFSHLGVGAVGGISVGAPPDLRGPQVAHIIKDSESKILFVENARAWSKIAGDVAELPSLERVVVMNNEPIDFAKAQSFTSFMAEAKKVSDDQLKDAKSKVSLRDCAALVYTSGTSGAPKGVMLSHDNAAFAGEAYVASVQPG